MSAAKMRVGFLGPEGTFSAEALATAGARIGLSYDAVPLETVYETLMAVERGTVDRALVPIENSLEGAVSVTLDTLALEARDTRILGEEVLPVHHNLIAAGPVDLAEIEQVRSHPHVFGQCTRLMHGELARARAVPATSTAEAVRTAVADGGTAAAIGSAYAAKLYGGEILRSNVEDFAGNETRFVWLGPKGSDPLGSGAPKTSIVFWGPGADASGWLVGCLSEFAFRGVNLTRIESRPLREGLGSYMFFLDMEGGAEEPAVAGALEALRAKTGELRLLGSYPSAG
jgi:prephenate dehydratase